MLMGRCPHPRSHPSVLNGDEKVRLRGGPRNRGDDCGVTVSQPGRNRDVQLIEPGAAESRECDFRHYTADRQP